MADSIIRVLDVYLKGNYIGKLTSQGSVLGFTYDPTYLQSKLAVRLSISFPLQYEAFSHKITQPFFSGLLPDGILRLRIARYFQVSEKNIFRLLEEIGGDCAGAVSLYKEGTYPGLKNKQTYYILDESKADNILSSLVKRHPFLVGDPDVRMTCAGAQDKLMISFVSNNIAIPIKDTSSTHIIKPDIENLNYSVQNEFFCMRLAQKIGLDVPEATILWVKNKAYYLIERYDRKIIEDVQTIRLHQEDFCQAMSIDPQLKYENDGGPGIEACFSLLEDRIRAGRMENINRLLLLRGIIFNFVIGNGDAHGKNFSLLYKDGKEILAPFYDILSTIVYVNAFKAKMSMKINGKYRFKDITMQDFKVLGRKLGFQEDFVESQVVMLSNTILYSANELVKELNSDIRTASEIYKQIYTVIMAHHNKLVLVDK